MPQEIGQTQEIDLEKTDRLPALDMAAFDQDDADDAVPPEHPAGGANLSGVATTGEFPRPSSLDLPSLAETVRSVEERIARQNAEHEALERAYQKALEAESAAVVRANALAADVASIRTALETQQARARDFEKALEDKTATVEKAKGSEQVALREAERLLGESRALKDSLATRDATIAQVLHSLGERDAQLVALQQQHAKIVPELEERYRTGSQLEADLQAARARAASLDQELNTSKSTVSQLSEQMKRRESELLVTRAELQGVRVQSTSFLESLRTRDWRQGYHHNVIREMEAEVDAAQAATGALQSERDRLQRQVDAQTAELEARRQSIDELRGAAANSEASLAARAQELLQHQQAHAELSARVAALEAEQTRLTDLVAARDAVIEATRLTGSDEARRLNELLDAAQQKSAQQAADIARLQSEAAAAHQEMSVLGAQLKEARRPIEVIEAEVHRLTSELTAMTARSNDVEGENAKLRSSLERTRGALEEREFLIRRLERSESNNANVLGRIQTSIERLGVTPAPPSAPAPVPAGGARPESDLIVELVRVDGGKAVTHLLGKRTRVGRAAGCELQIDSSSVSRHHALIVVGPRDIIIEDLNSTNGVLVNGRKVSRQALNDGDALTIGESQFRVSAKPASRARE